MKVKIIDILNRVAQEKNVPKKIKYYGVTYELQIERLDYVDDELNYLFDKVLIYGDYLFQHLNDEVEILDNETNELEEITYITSDENTMICIQKINELVKAINKLNNQDTFKKTNCMSD